MKLLAPPRPAPPEAPTAKVVDLTPELAAEWLARNTKNRNIRTRIYSGYARDMAAGNWRFTGEAIKFSKSGDILDGQHRLLAVVQSGATIKVLVVVGLDDNAQEVMDSGAKRTAGDALQLAGVTQSNAVAAAARFGLQMESEDGGRGVAYTHTEIRAYIDANPDVADAARTAHQMGKFIDINPSVLAYAVMVTARVSPTDSAVFFESLANNNTTGKGDPRNTLLQRMQAARRNRESIDKPTQFYFVIRAWNAWRNDENLHILKARNGVKRAVRAS